MTEAVNDEKDYISQSRNGDVRAFEFLVRRYQQMIHAVTFRMTGNKADAEELAQETFLQAWRRLSSYREDSRFSSWLYRIAMNASLNWIKNSRRRSALQIAWARENEASLPDCNRQVILDRVQAAMMKLRPKHRAAMILTIHEKMSHAEAARVLGCSESTVSWRVFAARRTLRRWLGSPSSHAETGADT